RVLDMTDDSYRKALDEDGRSAVVNANIVEHGGNHTTVGRWMEKRNHNTRERTLHPWCLYMHSDFTGPAQSRASRRHPTSRPCCSLLPSVRVRDVLFGEVRRSHAATAIPSCL